MTTDVPSAALAALARAYGVATEYWDWQGRHVTVSTDTIRAVLAALGVEANDDFEAFQALEETVDRAWRHRVPPFTLHRAGRLGQVRIHVPDGEPVEVWVELEDGGRHELEQLPVWVDPRTVDGALVGAATFALPPDLPLGWHTLCAAIPGAESPHEGTLAVTPGRLEVSEPLASDGAWGLMSQMYSVRSADSWGIGDFGDLADMAVWSAHELGADFTLINPVHAAEFDVPMEPSPYLPTSRRFVNPMYIRVEDIPEVGYLEAEPRARVRALAQRTQRLNRSERIDRDVCWEAKKEALRVLFAHPRSARRQAAFDGFCETEGPGLLAYATWCVLTEHHGIPLPEELSDSHSEAVAREREERADEVRFAMWCQWIADQQLAAVQREAREAGMTLGIMQDLAVGVHPQGADAWGLGDALAAGVTVGAPPDPYNQRGQNWSQPPWRPDRLADRGYLPFRDMIRAAMRHSGALRIDHIIGLFRLWWIPEGKEPSEGTYVRLDHEALIGILVLEAHLARAVVVGEDLGTVEPWVRDFLHECGVFGTSILWFERTEDGSPRRPEDYRQLCLASVTTHDLPPTAGYLTGEHIRIREELGVFTRPVAEELAEDQEARRQVISVLAERGLLDERDDLHRLVTDPSQTQLEQMIEGLHRYLSWSPALLLGVAVPDLVGDRRAMNQPGTSDEYPNWRLPLSGPDRRPLMLEDLMSSRWARRLGRCVHRGRRR